MKFSRILFILCLFIFVGCDQNPANISGGTISVTATHHGAFIKSGSAYLKSNADFNHFPGFDVSAYNLQQDFNSKTGEIVFRGLTKGDYWVYVWAYDSLISEQVAGAGKISIASAFSVEHMDIEVFEAGHIDTSSFQ